MTPSRVRRVLVFLGASAAVAILAPYLVPTRADERAAPVPWVQFDSVRITDALFSPNGDGVRDSVTFSLSLAEPIKVRAHVSPAGLPDTVAVLANSIPDPRIAFVFSWHGTDATGVVQPEGIYTVTLAGSTLADSTELFLERQVRIDLTPPFVEILAVIPPNYAPNTVHQGIVPEIRFRVSQSQLEDSVAVRIQDLPMDRIDQPLPIGGGFAGDGDYVTPCEDCAEGFFRDGSYVITVTGRDLAGNATKSDSILVKNIDGPFFAIERPRDPSPNQDPSGRFHFQFADSLVGGATDDQAVDSVTAVFVSAGDTTGIFIPRTGGVNPMTYLFNTDLSSLLTTEGVYDFTLNAYDEDQVSSDERLTIVIDRTPDPPPVITPRPPTRTKLEVLEFTVTTNDSLIREVIISGGKNTQTGSPGPDTLDVRVPSFTWQRTLNPGANRMSFESLDYARNISVADTITVVWETSEGLIAPERFLQGQSIQVDAGSTPAQRVVVRVLALDGSLVRTFQDDAPQLVYTFPWDLTTPEGRPVRNGAYLIYAQVRYPDGRESRFRRMIAIVR